MCYSMMAVIKIEVNICDELNFARWMCPQTLPSPTQITKENVNYTKGGVYVCLAPCCINT